jgi:hypothetical protein
VTLVGSVALGPIARGDTYQLSRAIGQRTGVLPAEKDYAYQGPQFVVTSWGTSVDTYVCPSGQSLSGVVVVGDIRDSADRSFRTDITLPVLRPPSRTFDVSVINWSVTAAVRLRAAVSCSTDACWFPYDRHYCKQRHCDYPPGDYYPWWLAVFSAGPPGETQYAELIKRAFCWGYPGPGSPKEGCGRPGPHTGQFTVHSGSDVISETFKDPASPALPPAVRLAGATGCAARQQSMSVEGGSGQLRLVLHCQRLKRHEVARLRIARPVRRSFRLHRGKGSIEVRLAKPPGSVQPLAYLGYGPENTRCGSVHDRLRIRPRSFSLRVNARCAPAAGNAVAHLYLGGLLR